MGTSKMDAKLVTTLCVGLVTSLLNAESHQNPTYFNIGGVLSNNDSEFHFQEIIAHLNFANQYVPKGVTYYATAIQMDANPIRTALNVCKYLIAQRVYAVVVSHPLIGDLSPAAVSYTSGFYHIPVIGISSRDSAFSDKAVEEVSKFCYLETTTPRREAQNKTSSTSNQAVEEVNKFCYLETTTPRREAQNKTSSTSNQAVEEVNKFCYLETTTPRREAQNKTSSTSNQAVEEVNKFCYLETTTPRREAQNKTSSTSNQAVEEVNKFCYLETTTPRREAQNKTSSTSNQAVEEVNKFCYLETTTPRREAQNKTSSTSNQAVEEVNKFCYLETTTPRREAQNKTSSTSNQAVEEVSKFCYLETTTPRREAQNKTSSTSNQAVEENIHVSFLRTVPPYSHQADVWVELLKHLKYMKIVFIHSSDTDGRGLLGRFQTASQNLEDDVEIKVTLESTIEFEPGLDTFTERLYESTHSAQSRVYLMYASKTDSEVIFRDAGLLNMTGASNVWIVTEQALEASNVPEGTLGLKLVNATDETAHIQDSIYVLASALKAMNQTETITEAPNDCNSSGTIWETGKKLFEYIKKQVLLNGTTGKVAFDDSGDRINAEYDIVNVQDSHLVSVGQYYYNSEVTRMRLRLDESVIVWPGRSKVKPDGIIIPTHLKVLTIEEKPFVYVREINNLVENCTSDEIPCPHFNATGDVGGKKEWTGLIGELSQYDCKVYNSCVPVGGKKEWTGLIGELVYDRANMIVAPLTINPERAEVIEFSKPFKYQGITILEKKRLRTAPSRHSQGGWGDFGHPMAQGST
uniref:(California timema) hypothetical protein n=1 Tax=Timema californicum TaxID=61474 RepID=A0A7R9JBI4_TIMCA|nr:unnamed protein product [Timema californicum]